MTEYKSHKRGGFTEGDARFWRGNVDELVGLEVGGVGDADYTGER